MKNFSKVRATVAGLLLGCAAAWAAEAVGDPFRNLLERSPFSSEASSGEALVPEAPLEWRGLLHERDQLLFSVFESATHRGRWVRLNDAANPFVVRSYDATKGELVVGYGHRDLVLTLKLAKVGLSPLATLPAAMPSVPGTGAKPANQEIVAVAASVDDEAIRLAAIAQEIARRQALRRRATNNPAAEPSFTPSP